MRRERERERDREREREREGDLLPYEDLEATAAVRVAVHGAHVNGRAARRAPPSADATARRCGTAQPLLPCFAQESHTAPSHAVPLSSLMRVYPISASVCA